MPSAPKNNKSRKRVGKAKAQQKEKPSKKENPSKGNSSEKSSGASVTGAGFPIVAIGASAGGFEAFSTLLRALPSEPGMALVFIPHLDPTHESAMVELLSRTTRLTVHQAAEGMPIACNSVYVL